MGTVSGRILIASSEIANSAKVRFTRTGYPTVPDLVIMRVPCWGIISPSLGISCDRNRVLSGRKKNISLGVMKGGPFPLSAHMRLKLLRA